MKQTLTYLPHSFGTHACRLQVEGLPDVSTGQAAGTVGIITGWRLDWVGHPQLEGRREHLQALMAAVLPYARHLISGVARAMGEGETPVTIGPAPEGGHQVRLRSGQADTPPLDLHLDDAELADLVRVLDQCRLDPRLQLPLPVPEPLPLPARELRHRLPLQRRLAAPVGGLAALALAAGLTSLMPPPRAPGGPQRASVSQPLPATGGRPANPTPVPVPMANRSAPEATTPGRLTRLRAWLLSRQTSGGAAPAEQSWQFVVNARGEVVAASPVAGNDGRDRARLGLPAVAVPAATATDTLLVRGDLRSPGFWELAPWHGW